MSSPKPKRKRPFRGVTLAPDVIDAIEHIRMSPQEKGTFSMKLEHVLRIGLKTIEKNWGKI